MVHPIELRGQTVPAGTQLLISPFGVHHRPDLWPNPEGFDPDRFEQAPAPMTWIPFGGGPRKCLGAHYAMTELQVVLATLISMRRFDLARMPHENPEGRDCGTFSAAGR